MYLRQLVDKLSAQFRRLDQLRQVHDDPEIKDVRDRLEDAATEFIAEYHRLITPTVIAAAAILGITRANGNSNESTQPATQE